MCSLPTNKISTQTFTVKSNIQEISLMEFYEHIIVETDITKKGIQSVKYQNLKKGHIEEKSKKFKKSNGEKYIKKNFLNCVTMIILLDKKINIKFFKNGVFQLTGCKNTNHVIKSITIIRTTLLKIKDHFKFEQGDNDLIVYIRSAMRNIDFDLGYQINRFSFFQYLVNTFKDNDNIVIPDAVGNKMDTKIKIRLTQEEILALPVVKLVFPSKQQTSLSFKDCLELKPESYKTSYKPKEKFVSIFVFQNGKVLLSAADETIQDKYFMWFLSLVDSIEDDIKLVKNEKKTFYINR
jgi:TATA-box binding protein (TBP) (component of TFIID and TFIIIB)